MTLTLGKYKVMFKGDQFDIALEGDSPDELVSEFFKARGEIETALKSRGQGIPKKRSRKSELSKMPIPPNVPEVMYLADLSIPNPTKSSFVERRQRLSNWDTLFFILHYKPTGLTNKQLRSLSEELGKPISYSWLDTSFHRRDDEGLVMSRRVPGQKHVIYFLTELGKKEAEKLIQQLESPIERDSKGK